MLIDELLHVGDFLRGALMGETAVTVKKEN